MSATPLVLARACGNGVAPTGSPTPEEGVSDAGASVSAVGPGDAAPTSGRDAVVVWSTVGSVSGNASVEEEPAGEEVAAFMRILCTRDWLFVRGWIPKRSIFSTWRVTHRTLGMSAER